jgi:hypothetical protein
MDLSQLVTVLGGVVLLVGLLRAHRVIVKEYLLPEIEPVEETEE